MKKAKIKAQKKIEPVTNYDEGYSIKQMVIIILILLAVFGIFYMITLLVVKPSEEEKLSDIVEIDSTKITLNKLLNRKESEYYVLATKNSLYETNIGLSNVNYSTLYNQYISDYQKEENVLKFYNVNLDDALNKNFLGDEMNITNDLSELKLNDEVLFKIENGKISSCYVGSSEIVEALSNLKGV